MPDGGRRLWVFHPTWHLPVLVVTQDSTGHEVEYYCYDRPLLNVPLDDEDFNPEQMGARRK
jgi:hypothetical protein